MARAHFADVLIGTSGTGALSLLDGATVHVYDQDTTNHIAQTLYAADSGGATIANPLTSDANGKVEFWLDTPARVDLAASKTGFSPSTRTVDVEDVPVAVSGTPTIGDTLVYDGTKYVPQAPGGGGSGGLLVTDPIEINSADLIALGNDTPGLEVPILLVASPGPGRWIVPTMIASTPHPGDTPYSGGTVSVTSGPIAEPIVEGNVWWSRDLNELCGNTVATQLFGLVQPPGDYGLVDKGLWLSRVGGAFNGNGSFALTIAYFVAGSAPA